MKHTLGRIHCQAACHAGFNTFGISKCLSASAFTVEVERCGATVTVLAYLILFSLRTPLGSLLLQCVLFRIDYCVTAFLLPGLRSSGSVYKRCCAFQEELDASRRNDHDDTTSPHFGIQHNAMSVAEAISDLNHLKQSRCVPLSEDHYGSNLTSSVSPTHQN